MPHYDIDLADQFAVIAQSLANQPSSPAAARASLYLSCLATELALKFLLERAGHDVQHIKNRHHRLVELLNDTGKCSISTNGYPQSAAAIRSLEVSDGNVTSTVGQLLEMAEADQDASPYPNGIRYGEEVRHFPPQAMAAVANQVVAFAREHGDTIRR